MKASPVTRGRQTRPSQVSPGPRCVTLIRHQHLWLQEPHSSQSAVPRVAHIHCGGTSSLPELQVDIVDQVDIMDQVDPDDWLGGSGATPHEACEGPLQEARRRSAAVGDVHYLTSHPVRGPDRGLLGCRSSRGEPFCSAIGGEEL